MVRGRGKWISIKAVTELDGIGIRPNCVYVPIRFFFCTICTAARGVDKGALQRILSQTTTRSSREQDKRQEDTRHDQDMCGAPIV